jgi:hypothetical protein
MLSDLRKRIAKITLVFIGFISLIWFLVRVIPKPARAAYPCQRAAFPFASAFVIWLVGAFSGKYFFTRAKAGLKRANYLLVIIFLSLAIVCFSLISLPFVTINAANKEKGISDFTPTDNPNTPIGLAKGIFPGRVVWCYNPNATNWSGVISKSMVDGITGATTPVSDGNWFEEGHIIQSQVDLMISEAICSLTGKNSDAQAWDAIFRYFNTVHGNGETGYLQGEKIAVKINLNTSSDHGPMNGMVNISPQMVFGLLKQLVSTAGVPAKCITFYDVSRYVPSSIYDLCKQEFPEVNFVDQTGGDGRLKGIADVNNKINWSQVLDLEPLADPAYAAYLPTCVTEAKYIINFSNLKGHSLAGVTFCAKNLLGSFIAPNPSGLQPPQAAGIHPYIAVNTNEGYDMRPMKSYNCLVDLMGNEKLGGKTLLYLIDGLYAATWQGVVLDYRCKWKSAPFNGNWTSSMFASFDDVALESVCLDFCREEQTASVYMTQVTGNVDNYLHEAALANDPPSGTYYHPNGGILESLGVHEHWNNANEKLYTRNMGTGNGIELVPILHSWIATAIKSTELSQKFVVFPLPASDIIKVKLSDSFKGEVKMEIFNTNGTLLDVKRFYKDTSELIEEINISRYKGTLVLKLSVKDQNYSRIIVRK